MSMRRIPRDNISKIEINYYYFIIKFILIQKSRKNSGAASEI